MTPSDGHERYFLKGDYKRYIDGFSSPPVTELGFYLGALVFLGRLKEAEVLYEAYRDQGSYQERVKGAFFLAIGSARLSQNDKARQYIGDILGWRRGFKDQPLLLFYLYQGLAFYRFSICQYGKAYHWIERSFRSAILSCHSWQRVLALDLKGYILRAIGAPAPAIRCLEEAHAGAKAFGNGGLCHAIGLSLTCFRAEVGVLGTQAIGELEALSRKVAKKDNYSKASLHLELSRHLSLMGQVKASEKVLSQVAQSIFASSHQRFQVTLQFRMAYNAFLSGDTLRALEILMSCESLVSSERDRSLCLMIKGLQKDLHHLLGVYDHHREKDIEHLTRVTQSGMGARILSRRKKALLRGQQKGEDPFGDLLDDLCHPENSLSFKVQRILASGYLSLIRQVMEVSPGEEGLYLDLVPHSLLIFSKGEIRYIPKGITPTIRAFIKALAQNVVTKEALIEGIWGYRYNSLRHDHMIYGVAARLRGLLGEFAYFLQGDEAGYGFLSGIRIRFHQHLAEHQGRKAAYEIPIHPSAPVSFTRKDSWPKDLSPRQIEILQWLKQKQFVGVNEVREHFRVAKVTGTRDLASLCKYGLIEKLGKGRATRYRLLGEWA